MVALAETLSDDDRRLLIAHFQFYSALDSGRRTPTTAAQRHFVAVCRGTELPETDHERAYSRFKHAGGAEGVNEATVIAAGFVLPLEPYGDNLDASEVIEVPIRACAACGHPIPPERLEALPNAIRCVRCEQQAEAAPIDPRVSGLDCPRCTAQGFSARLVWRTARDPEMFSGYFLGCSRFPDCRYVDRS